MKKMWLSWIMGIKILKLSKNSVSRDYNYDWMKKKTKIRVKKVFDFRGPNGPFRVIIRLKKGFKKMMLGRTPMMRLVLLVG